MIWVIGWQLDFLKIDVLGNIASLATTELVLCKDRLIRLRVRPLLAMVELAVGNEVVIGLGFVGDEVTSVAKGSWVNLLLTMIRAATDMATMCS